MNFTKMFQVSIALLLIHFLLVSKKAVYCRDQRKFISHPSLFLEPPPISRSIKAYPLLHKHPPPIKHAHPHHAPHNNHYNADSMLPKLTNWLWPAKKERDKAESTISSKSILQTRSHDFAIDKKCNPCNSVPWIPILGVNHHVAKQLEPVTFHQPTAYSADSYYSSFNDIPSNSNPLNVVPSAVPLYFGNSEYTSELTHNHLQDNKFESGAFPATSWNAGSFSSSGIDNLQEPSLHNPQVGASSHFVQNTSLDNWPYEPKAMPLSHYLWSVDYPMQIYQTPLLDVPSYQLPGHGVDLPLHVQNQVFHSTVPPSHVLSHHFTSPTAEGSHDQYKPLGHNFIDDNKYSPSESKFTSVAAESSHINDSYLSTPPDFSDNITESLIDFLTPPPAASPSDWFFETKTETAKKKKQIQIVIPYTVNKNHIQVQPNESDNWTTEGSLSQKLKDIWSSFTETTTPLPIVSYLKGNSSVTINKVTLPNKRQEWSDMLRLQKAIDTWTVEGYSNHKHKPNDYYFQKVVTSTLNPSKEIPQNYLASTVSYLHKEPIRYRVKYNQSPMMEEKMHKNSYEGGASYKHNSTSKPWEKLPISVSPLTKEKVYIVTPLPLTSYNFSADGVIENWP